MRPSTLRYYEQEGLLTPDTRSDAGYRLYSPWAEQRLLLIQRAQRLGFSLSDVRTLLDGWDGGDLSDAAIIETAENRYLALEKRITELLTLKHELELFLQDLHRRDEHSEDSPGSSFAQMLARVCANPLTQPPATDMLDWLMQYAGCRLTSEDGKRLLDKLRGQHVHIWQEGDAYHILIVSDDPAVARALRDLAELEADCEAHSSYPTPELLHDDEGLLLKAKGPNAFIFARLFLALEQELRV
jgi:DNA-binding transcriptional MerR regulator